MQTTVFSTEETINVLFNLNTVELAYDYRNILVFPRNSQVRIEIKNQASETYQFAKAIADRILMELHHTPVKSVHIETVFILPRASAPISLLKPFDEIKMPGYEPTAIKFARDQAQPKEVIVSTVNQDVQVSITDRHSRQEFLSLDFPSTIETNSREVTSIWQVQ